MAQRLVAVTGVKNEEETEVTLNKLRLFARRINTWRLILLNTEITSSAAPRCQKRFQLVQVMYVMTSHFKVEIYLYSLKWQIIQFILLAKLY